MVSTTEVAVTNAQHQTLNHEKTMQEESLPLLFGEAIDDGDYRLELAHLLVKYYGLALLNIVTSATPNHQARKDVCIHLISALKVETTFEIANHGSSTSRRPILPA